MKPDLVLDDGGEEMVWISSMGRLMRVSMKPADAARLRKGNRVRGARKAAATRRAKTAVDAYINSAGDLGAALAAVATRTRWEDSSNRLLQLLILVGHAPPTLFWPAFHADWPHCDGTWWIQDLLLGVLRRQAPALISDAFFDALPAQVRVFRGCSRERVRGVSWTLDRRIAEGFAQGHRFIPVPDPIIASAIIDKSVVFLASDERHENEVLLDPDHLRELELVKGEP
jgi:hypothetical protein